MGRQVKTSQLIMIWLLPLVVVGGLFVPLLGYLVLLMMITLLILAYFRGRFWCWHLCPRGAFLDLVLAKFSLKKKIPRLFTKPPVRWAIFALFMLAFTFQLITADKAWPALGFVFVRMCLVTTLIAIFIGIPINQRAWCAICPMGTLQGKINSCSRRKK